jgi:nitroimidazol reductase NimA-like FMN-containing flavoprotein (pyridoxamine 5'-phosphate oxidase superfamily)
MATTTPISEETIRPEDGRTVPWEDAAKRLAEADSFWMATVRRDGHPHVRPILAVWVDDALHFVASTSSRKAANLAHRSSCSVSTGTPGLDLVVEGEAVRVTDEGTLKHVADAYDSKYGWPVEIRDGAFHAEGAPTAGPPPFHIYELQPSTVYAFGTDEDHFDRSARWRFPARPHRED